jgi:hypothetical protein
MHINRIVIVAIAALATIGVPLNALFLQDGRHPAPLFQHSAKRTPAFTGNAPMPPPRPLADTARPSAARSSEIARDPIGLLLLGGSVKAEETDKRALFAQRALVKLGYNVRIDGKFGGSTRRALEKFERDSGLPVKGELSPKVLRQLSSHSGVAIE